MDLALQLLQQQYQNENNNKDKKEKFIEYLDANIQSYEQKMIVSKNPIERAKYKRYVLNMMNLKNSLSAK